MKKTSAFLLALYFTGILSAQNTILKDEYQSAITTHRVPNTKTDTDQPVNCAGETSNSNNIKPKSYFCDTELTDPRDGNVYPIVQIGNQCWMAENLAFLPAVSPASVGSHDDPLYYVYGYNGTSPAEAIATQSYFIYGVLYNQAAASTACPQGWYLPTDNDWKILEGFADSQYEVGDPNWNISGWRGYDVGKNLKALNGWYENTGNDLYGFSALPGGYRNIDGNFWEGSSGGVWWSSSVSTTTTFWSRYLLYSADDSYRYDDFNDYGFSVRCLKNESQTSLPTVTTSDVENITGNSARCGGNVTDDGGVPVSSRGLIWNTVGNPTVDDYEGISYNGDGTGSFTSYLTYLDPETQYFVRAFAINSAGTAYGEQLSFVTTSDFDDWTLHETTLYSTSEAEIVHRTGDIDNLGFGWPEGFNPFSGEDTPVHSFPFYHGPDDPDGTDRIMVISGYDYFSGGWTDGYTATTQRPDNLPQSIVLQFNTQSVTVQSVVVQMFVDDFQRGVFGNNYFQVSIDNIRIPILETVINALDQTGPIGKLITVPMPATYTYLFEDGEADLLIDDSVNNVGDGFAIDFVRLLINPSAFQNTGSIEGYVYDEEDNPIEGATVEALGIAAVNTDEYGYYFLQNIPAGLVFVSAGKVNYSTQSAMIDVVDGTVTSQNFILVNQFIELCESLDNCDLTFSTGGSGGEMPWYGQSSITYDGEDAAQSGVTGDDEQTWMEIWITGPGVISFWWKVSSEINFDFLKFFMNDAEQDAISGEVDWTYMEFEVPDATLPLRWEYSKDGSALSNQDAGWVDLVQFTLGGNLCEALDNCDLTFQTGGTLPWFSQEIISFDLEDAAQSGAIQDDGFSWIETIVEGPGILTFYWKVSSEYNHDFLSFQIDGVPVDWMSGEIDWHYKEFEFPAGYFALTWWYTKDGSASSGMDAGWLDQVAYTSTTNPESELYLIGDIIPPDPGGCFAATDLIVVSDFQVLDGGDVTLVVGPGGTILLQEGTQVQSGGYLRAWIDEFENYCNQPESMIAEKHETVPEKPVIKTGDNTADFFKVYPNPTSGILILEMDTFEVHSESHIEIYNMEGRMIFTCNICSASITQLDLSGLANGLYFLRLVQESRFGAMKILKQ